MLSRRKYIVLISGLTILNIDMNLDHKHDWIEPVRRYLYPKLHKGLELFGGYGVGYVVEEQYAATIPEGEELFEEVLSDHGWRRNPVAAYKVHTDGRESEGSWRLRDSQDEYGLIPDGDKQLHITLFNNEDAETYVDVYCHLEYDWVQAPVKHLRSTDLDAKSGSEAAREFIRDYTYLDWYHKEEDLDGGR